MFNAAEEMTATEREFVKTYARALLDNSELVCTVVSLMHEDGLAVKNVVAATDAALKLNKLEADFVQELALVATRNKLPEKRGLKKYEKVVDDVLLNVFGLSFFKLNIKLGSTKGKKHEAGWFSGKPIEWAGLFKKLSAEKAPPPPPKTSSIFYALAQLFNVLLPPKEAGPTKIWPPAQLNIFMASYDSDVDDDEDWYYDDDIDDDLDAKY